MTTQVASSSSGSTSTYARSGRRQSSNVSWKSNEIADLRNRFRDPTLEEADEESGKTELIKKVISLTTSGVDTSLLFPEMLLAGATGTFVEKKLVYLYIGIYARENQDLALLCINTFQKDCADESPVIRGLALRCFSGLRLPYLAEHITPLLDSALADKSPYVRRTAILSSIDHFVCIGFSNTASIREKIEKLVYDVDNSVCVTALTALSHFPSHPDNVHSLDVVAISKNLTYFLLNRLRDMTDWQISVVLEFTANYVVEGEEEMYNIMNLLEENIKTLNLALLIAISNFFLRLARKEETLLFHVCNRLRKPFLLMCAYSSYEIQYTLLMHLKFLVDLCPNSFQDSYKRFSSRLSEPTYIKMVKVDILTRLLTEKNVEEIFDELTDCLKESRDSFDVQTKCVRGIDAICDFCVAHRSEIHHNTFLKLSQRLHIFYRRLIDHPYDESYREIALCSLPKISILEDFQGEGFVNSFLTIHEARNMRLDCPGIAISILRTIRMNPEPILHAPYILELLIELCPHLSSEVQDELLTTTVIVFAKRPCETINALRRLLHFEIRDFNSTEVHSRAIMYYRALQQGVSFAESVAHGNYSGRDLEDHVQNADEKMISLDMLFDEYNTMSIILNKPFASQ